jgi:hypothetical protein
MDLQSYIQYILSWVYHNVLYTEASFAIVRILIFIGLVSLLVYRQYILFVLLCIVVICAEYCNPFGDARMCSVTATPTTRSIVVDKDQLTTGVSINNGREGFSLTMPKIIKGDATGQDHRRSNKFVEEDSRDFTEKDFSSKQCSIGTGMGGITMFGSNELIGNTRDVSFSRIYDFAGNVTDNTSKTDDTINQKRVKYFNDCVYNPVKRNDFRAFKKKIYTGITASVIDIDKCLARFNTGVLFNTSSNISAGYSLRLTTLTDGTVSGTNEDDTYVSFAYVSLIAGGANNEEKLSNIQALNRGNKADNFTRQTYSELLRATNESADPVYTTNRARKQQAMDIFGKVYGYRTRIDEILAMMRAQTRDDATAINTVRIGESVIQELRTMLSYLAIIQRTDAIIKFEEAVTFPLTTTGPATTGIYNMLNKTPKPTTLDVLPNAGISPITGTTNIFKIPLDDDTYNTNDEKRYLYGITYYFGKTTG